MKRTEETNGGKDEGIVLMTNIRAQCEKILFFEYLTSTIQLLVVMFNSALIYKYCPLVAA